MQKILNEKCPTRENLCECREKENCPLDGKCLQTEIIYKASIHSNNVSRCYFGLNEGQFKTRYNNHIKSFKNSQYGQDTELAKYVWKLKDENKQFNITWEIAAHANAYMAGSKRCNLCLTDKFLIANGPRESLLNKKSELITSHNLPT